MIQKQTMRNRFLSLILVFVMVFSMIPVNSVTAAASASDGTCTVEDVRSMIDALPDVSKLEDMSEEALDSVYEQAQEIYDVYETLTDKEQVELADELVKLRDVLDYFSITVMPMAGVSGIYKIAIAADPDSASNAKNKLSGYKVLDQDLNEDASGDYIYLGYQAQLTETGFITGIIFYQTENQSESIPESKTYGGHTYYLLGSSSEPNDGGGVINLNNGTGKNDPRIYMYITRDITLLPITTLYISTGKSESSGACVNTNGDAQDLNKGAGGKYIWLKASTRFQATYSSKWSYDATHHWHANTEVPAYVKGKAAHTWSNGTCSVCKYSCKHPKYTNGKCSTCGVAHSNHTWKNGTCSTCGIAHTGHTWKNGNCSVCGIAHTGHTWSGGKCTVCQYVCKHDGTTNGYCSICGEYLSGGTIVATPKQENGIYLIYTPGELAWFSAYVNSKNASIKGKLMADINMSNTTWSTIGTSSRPYTGTFDGNGKKVTLKLSGSAEYLAMFSYVKGASIQNLTVDGSVNPSYHFAASIIGRADGGTVTLKNCLSTVTINSSYDGDGTHGGLVSIAGSGTLNIQNCGFAGKIIGTKTTYCGGMVGWTDKSAKTNISNSYVAAEFNLSGNSGNTFGRNPNYVSLTNCYYLNALSDASVAKKMSASSFQSGEVTWLLNNKSTSGVWKQKIGSDNYPNFSGGTVYYGYKDCTDMIYSNSSLSTTPAEHPEFDSKGFCTKCGGYQPAVWNDSKSYYEISNAGQLFWFAQFVNKGNKSANAVLMKDIDLENRAWTPIGRYSDDPAISSGNVGYTGTFDGQCHVISNLNVNMTENCEAGLFGRVAGGGVLKNFGVINATVKQNQNGHENKGVRAGIIAGEIYRATVENVFSAGDLTLQTKHDQYGGLAGECKESTLKSCYTTMGRLTDGTSGNTPKSVKNCFYQANSKNNASAGDNMNEAQFKSGNVTYKLNNGVYDGSQVFYQTIGTDNYPKFSGDTVYYQDNKFNNYYVDMTISWTSMEFTYNSGTWNEKNHSYQDGYWDVAEENGNVITLENHSTGMYVSFDYVSELDGVSGSFDVQDSPIKAGDKISTSLTLSGIPAEEFGNAQIGSVKVSISGKPDKSKWKKGDKVSYLGLDGEVYDCIVVNVTSDKYVLITDSVAKIYWLDNNLSFSQIVSWVNSVGARLPSFDDSVEKAFMRPRAEFKKYKENNVTVTKDGKVIGWAWHHVSEKWAGNINDAGNCYVYLAFDVPIS